jgi:tRNA A-37 threonylcarbamoyl transferase component Bud32/WD40 repeat protein
MGEVYRARDTKLHRDVALKTLPEAFARDEERLLRFKREAQVLASLNHPNIAAIYGFEDASIAGLGVSRPVQALVLELVEGPTLADRIREDAIPVDEALPIARQIAEALEAAHEHGVVHRDLKPANVRLTADGIVKVLDFGLAKALTPDVGSAAPDVTASPTITSAAMTALGVILGTAAYMAPEQAKSRPADKRADLWAFGCVLYEMLTGRALFAGDDVSDTLANVLKREPDWNALPSDVPPAIRALLKRCLEKDRRQRVADSAAAVFVIDESTAFAPAAPPTTAPQPQSSMIRRVAVPFAALVLVAALAGIPTYFRAAPPSVPEMGLQIVTPPTGELGAMSFAASHDGRVVFRGRGDRTEQLWLRTLGSETARPLEDTENATYPFWSADGRSIGFFADQRMKRMDAAGGKAQTIAETPQPFGATWNTNGVIVFSGASTAPLFRVPAAWGQQSVEATTLKPGQVSHRFPEFLPDGRRFLFHATGVPEVQDVSVGSLDSTETKRRIEADTRAAFLPPDWVLFVRDEALYAQRVELDELTIVGDPVLVAGRIALSPGNFVWSPDGSRIAFQSNRKGGSRFDLYQKSLSGKIERLVLESSENKNISDWSPDGRFILYSSQNAKTARDIWAVPLDGDQKPFVVVQTPFEETGARFSPDGRWIAYNVKTKPLATKWSSIRFRGLAAPGRFRPTAVDLLRNGATVESFSIAHQIIS